MILWVRLPLWSLKHDPVVQWRRRLDDTQEIGSSILPGITCDNWSVSVVGARRCGKAEDRVQSPDGPLDKWACMPMGATDPCKIGVIGSTPIRSTEDGLMVQRDDTALAWRKSGFDSRSVH